MSERKKRSDAGVPRKASDPRMDFLRWFARQAKAERIALMRDVELVDMAAECVDEKSAATLPGVNGL